MPEGEAVNMGNTVRIDELADAVMEGLVEYADLAADEVKGAVKRAGESVRRDIADHAPKRTGAYGKSWAVRNTRACSHRIRGSQCAVGRVLYD